MKKRPFLLLAALGMASALSACGGGSGGSTTVVTPPSGSVDPKAKYGTQFAADFKADPNSTPASVSASDVVPVDPTASPSPIQ